MEVIVLALIFFLKLDELFEIVSEDLGVFWLDIFLVPEEIESIAISLVTVCGNCLDK